MNLLDLPVEIGILIFSYLDIKSKINAYGIVELREFYAPCLLRKLDISRSSVASVKTLALDIFQDFATNILELNLSGIADLTADKLMPHILKCCNLKTLDVTFTRIRLPDLAHICTEYLKNISINFFKEPIKHVCEHERITSLDIFKRQHFEDVRFVVFNFFYADEPLVFMKDVPRTKYLKITVADGCRELSEINPDLFFGGPPSTIDIDFTKLFYSFRDYQGLNFPSLRGVSNLNYTQIEYIFIMYRFHNIQIYASPIFSRMFALHFSGMKIKTYNLIPRRFRIEGNIIFKAWNKSITDFNDAFFDSLLHELADYFPTYMCMHQRLEMKVTEAPSNWICIDAREGFERVLDKLPEKVTLTNRCFRRRTVSCNRPISLSESRTLRNLTYLGLYHIRFNEDFFATLFVQCGKLDTLDVSIRRAFFETYRDSVLSLSNSIHLAKSLKNIKLTLCHVDYEIIFTTLWQCPTLENVYIIIYDRYEHNSGPAYIVVQNMLLLIEKCHDLYSFFIVPRAYSYGNKLLSSLRAAAQNLERDHLNIQVCAGADEGWNPFADVFNPSHD